MKTQLVPSLDVTQILVQELKGAGYVAEVINVLEARGFLLEAADELTKVAAEGQARISNARRANAMKAKYIELVMLVNQLDIDILRQTVSEKIEHLDIDSRCSLAISKSSFSGDFAVSDCAGSTMWKSRALLKQMSQESPEDLLLSSLPGETPLERIRNVSKLADDLKEVALSLASASHGARDELAIRPIESYFDLSRREMNNEVLETRPVTNSHLREVLSAEQCELPLASGLQKGFVQLVNRQKMHEILANFVLRQVFLVRKKVGEMLDIHLRDISCHNDLDEYIGCLQMRLLGLKELGDLLKEVPSRRQKWTGAQKAVKRTNDIAEQLLDILMHERNGVLSFEGGSTDNDEAILIKPGVADALYVSLNEQYHNTESPKKKCDISRLMNRWRVTRLIKTYEVANKELSDELKHLERHPSTKKDKMGGKRKQHTYFLNSKGEIFPRLWLWIVETKNLMKYVHVFFVAGILNR